MGVKSHLQAPAHEGVRLLALKLLDDGVVHKLQLTPGKLQGALSYIAQKCQWVDCQAFTIA